MYRYLFLILSFLILFTCKGKKKAVQTQPNINSEINFPDANYDLTGKWIVKVITPVGIHYPEMILEQKGNVATGDLSGNSVSVMVMGDSVAFSSSRKTPIGTWDFDYTGNLIAKDTMNGNYSMRSGPFAKKIYDWGARRVVD